MRQGWFGWDIWMIFACAFISIFGRTDPDSGSFHRSILISLRSVRALGCRHVFTLELLKMRIMRMNNMVFFVCAFILFLDGHKIWRESFHRQPWETGSQTWYALNYSIKSKKQRSFVLTIWRTLQTFLCASLDCWWKKKRWQVKTESGFMTCAWKILIRVYTFKC